MKTLRLILWDQLAQNIAALSDVDFNNDTILMCELLDDCTYVKHHKKKLIFILSAMSHFKDDLIDQGYNLIYVQLDDPMNSGTLEGEIKRVLENNIFDQIVVTWPGEYRVLDKLLKVKEKLSIPVHIREDNRFLASHSDFEKWAGARKELRMEYFYREMRQKYTILMDGDQPCEGKWNFDSENRKVPKEKLNISQTYLNVPDDVTKEVIKLVTYHFSDHFGDSEPFHFAVTSKEAHQAFDLFLSERLVRFGDFQDLMIENEPWMYHSHISFYMNVGLLDPLYCIKCVETMYRKGKVAINAAEGFIRQILGWREYVRGIYWLKMPEYKQLNVLNAKLPLPDFYWTAETKMNCIKSCVTETKENAYAHHIQRLMVLGNFALIAGVDPTFVNQWYFIVYADAFEWVELPNVTGMVLFADGGLLASKPYAASGAYINKMSNYCENCFYRVKEKNGSSACPFNYLYWDFLIRNRDQLESNHRLRMIYAVLDKKDSKQIDAISSDAQIFLEGLGQV